MLRAVCWIVGFPAAVAIVLTVAVRILNFIKG
jgi:hypothetical protein